MGTQDSAITLPVGPRKYEAAKRLGVSEQTISRLIKRGRLDAVKIGDRAVIVTEESIQQLLRGER